VRSSISKEIELFLLASSPYVERPRIAHDHAENGPAPFVVPMKLLVVGEKCQCESAAVCPQKKFQREQ
jgi:hypothetical protein